MSAFGSASGNARRRLPRLALVTVLATASSGAAHADPTPSESPAGPPDHRESPYRISLALDLPVTLAAATVWLVPGLALARSIAGPACDVCDPAQLNALDRLVVGHQEPVARTLSDWYFLLPAAFAVADVLDVGISHWRSWAADLVVVAEALTINGALDEVVRRAVRRPRPFLYTAGLYPDERALPEATFSFYSGHTSAMFTLATSLAYTFHLRHPQARSRYVVWTAALALASVEGALRVIGGAHFPSDVIVGAIIGTSIGVLVPELHRRRFVVPGVIEAGISLAPTTGGALLGVGGVLW